jgi:hypothetical protein
VITPVASHGYLAYAGTYAVVDDSIVEHHVDCSLFPNDAAAHTCSATPGCPSGADALVIQ